MARPPLVTIGLPVRNGEPHLREALDSILAQTVEDFELVIADNGSLDETEQICRAYAEHDRRIRYYRHGHNLGAARNFNFTFRQSRGTYFKWMAHDDRIEPTFLQRCLERFEQGPASLVMCYAQRRLITHDGRPAAQPNEDGAPPLARDSREGPSFKQILHRPPDEFPMYVFGLIRAAALRRTRLIGAFPSADLVLVAELRLLGPFGAVDEPLYVQRRHARNGEWLARASKAGEAQWYDPDPSAEPRASSWRLFTEHLRGIASRPVSPTEKLRAYAAMTSYFPARVRRLMRNRTFGQRVKEELISSADARLY
ncbi:MAG: glycosyltransferase family 2 protein [Phycisphaeraceae bacterium]